MKERISKDIVASTEGQISDHITDVSKMIQLDDQGFTTERVSEPTSYILEGKTYFVGGQTHKPDDKNKLEPYLLLYRQTDIGADHFRSVRKSDL